MTIESLSLFHISVYPVIKFNSTCWWVWILKLPFVSSCSFLTVFTLEPTDYFFRKILSFKMSKKDFICILEMFFCQCYLCHVVNGLRNGSPFFNLHWLDTYVPTNMWLEMDFPMKYNKIVYYNDRNYCPLFPLSLWYFEIVHRKHFPMFDFSIGISIRFHWIQLHYNLILYLYQI